MRDGEMRSVLTLLEIGLCGSLFSQGDLDHLKKQSYLGLYNSHPFNCDSIGDDETTTLHDRICENLRLQRSDSMLRAYYDSVVVEIRKIDADTLLKRFEELQGSWREFRDEQCKYIVADVINGSVVYYDEGVSNNSSAAAYMFEMRKLTDIRVEELKRLVAFYRLE